MKKNILFSLVTILFFVSGCGDSTSGPQKVGIQSRSDNPTGRRMKVDFSENQMISNFSNHFCHVDKQGKVYDEPQKSTNASKDRKESTYTTTAVLNFESFIEDLNSNADIESFNVTVHTKNIEVVSDKKDKEANFGPGSFFTEDINQFLIYEEGLFHQIAKSKLKLKSNNKPEVKSFASEFFALQQPECLTFAFDDLASTPNFYKVAYKVQAGARQAVLSKTVAAALDDKTPAPVVFNPMEKKLIGSNAVNFSIIEATEERLQISAKIAYPKTSLPLVEKCAGTAETGDVIVEYILTISNSADEKMLVDVNFVKSLAQDILAKDKDVMFSLEIQKILDKDNKSKEDTVYISGVSYRNLLDTAFDFPVDVTCEPTP